MNLLDTLRPQKPPEPKGARLVKLQPVEPVDKGGRRPGTKDKQKRKTRRKHGRS